jgi:hypothetical protein
MFAYVCVCVFMRLKCVKDNYAGFVSMYLCMPIRSYICERTHTCMCACMCLCGGDDDTPGV